MARALQRRAVDLDEALARQHGRPLRDWVHSDERGFREAERAAFLRLPPGLVVAVGGGFLAHHAAALRGCVAVEIPVSFDTYAERLRADPTRPRLRPELSLAEELREVYAERSARHASARAMPFVEFLARLARGERSRRVVTLPPGEPLELFAWAARHAGAELLEVRSDLHPPQLDLLEAARALPLLVAERAGAPLPRAWVEAATLVDREAAAPSGAPGGLRSLHAPAPLTTEEALARWSDVPPDSRVKHVEPLGEPSTFPRLLETQARLIERFGADRVTVLATGALALPFRAVLNQRNALDYLAFSSLWRAAEGQRLLADAVREARHATHDGARARLGILGSAVGHSRSPRLHAQPFDRIELPADTELGPLLAALTPHFRGFAVTNPFKKRVLPGEAVNTLVRAPDGAEWRGENTDVEGARVMWERLGRPAALTVLGDGGVTAALRLALPSVKLEVRTRAALEGPLRGVVVWTWPASVAPPAGLRFEGARVAVVAYGSAALAIAREITARGGEPVRLGAAWFIAQARRQRALWETTP